MEFYHNKAINSWYKATTTKLLLVTYFNELELFSQKIIILTCVKAKVVVNESFFYLSGPFFPFY